ncbi:MAG TPA: response regulator [Anaerolineae bacterium]|nr:response regulator [Anaerolineae bacterium]
MALIFVVDDDPVVCRLARHILQLAGHQVAIFYDGEEALAALAHSTPDVVITDLMMPRLNGMELLQRIRADERWAALPVVMLTARGGMNDRRLAEAAGVSHFLTKPFSSAQLIDQIDKLCP